MRMMLTKNTWRLVGVFLLTLVLITTTALSFASGHALQASQARHGSIPGRVFHMSLGGTVDWSRLPRVAKNSKPIPTHPNMSIPDPLTSAQRQSYDQRRTQHKLSLPKITGMPMPGAAQVIPNANFDACNYNVLPCVAHTWYGLNSSESTVPYYPPPTQVIASNPTYVMQGNDNIFAVANFSGSLVFGPTSSYSFFASILQSNDQLNDPQMFWDATRQHWIIIEAEFNENTFGVVNNSYLDIGISKTANATVSAPSQWYLYQLNVTAILGSTLGSGNTYWCNIPKLGGDYWGLWISCPAYATGSFTFAGNVVFGLSKNALYTGSSGTAFFWENIPLALGAAAYNLSPAYEDGTPDAEFLIATEAGYGGPYNGVTTVAFTDTRALALGSIPTLTYVFSTLPYSYTDPASARQPQYTLPVAAGVNAVEYKAGNLYFAMTTYTSNSNDGIYWAEMQPQLSPLNPSNPASQTVAAPIVRQSYIFDYADSTVDAFVPTLMGSSEDDETLVYNYSGLSVAPSVVFTGRRATDAANDMGGASNASALIVGGSYSAYYYWGQYAGCSLDTNLTSRGLIWCVSQYTGPQSAPNIGGWDAWVYALEVE